MPIHVLKALQDALDGLYHHVPKSIVPYGLVEIIGTLEAGGTGLILNLITPLMLGAGVPIILLLESLDPQSRHKYISVPSGVYLIEPCALYLNFIPSQQCGGFFMIVENLSKYDRI